ncbi:hypothetical protein RLOC_00005572 [Lonchura striata]|uniref:Uncharacterized protein n=1 Tax=Lonchura striata TaxID=40157 RepID=A0A218URF2_9PASE|nr:hypothetical protein RLOC_00005572 [Lonchura striata domestica]
MEGADKTWLCTSSFAQTNGFGQQIIPFALVFPVGQKAPESAWMMNRRKHSWAAIVGGNKKGEKMAGENARMLPKATREERKKQEAKRKEKLKTLAGKLLKTAVGGKETVEKAGAEDVAGNLLKRPSSRKGVERGLPAEETICRFIEQGKFLEACDQIHNLEHSGSDGMGKSESLYVLLAERMWTVVGEALGGSDRMLLEPLQSVGESLKWEKQKEAERLGNGLETDSVSTWSPNFWRKDLEEKLMQYMTAQIPLFASSANTDETALKQHLSHLEMTFLPSLEHRSDVFKEAGLLVTYARCCHASLCSHLATLTDRNCFSFSQSLLIHGWIIKMYKSSSGGLFPQTAPEGGKQCGGYMLVIIRHMKEVGKALKEAFDIGKPPCADAAVIEILTEKTETARRVSESLSEKVEAECLEECLRFLESYEDEVRSFLQLDGCPQICSSLRILENCCLLRMEDDIMEHFLQTITTKVKVWLSLAWCREVNLGIFALEQALVKAANAIIITEYMQALLTTPRKPSVMQRRRIVNKMEEDHRMMQAIFKECLGPAAGSLKDPIKAILELVQTSDPEGMKIALLPILKEFPDLRGRNI